MPSSDGGPSKFCRSSTAAKRDTSMPEGKTGECLLFFEQRHEENNSSPCEKISPDELQELMIKKQQREMNNKSENEFIHTGNWHKWAIGFALSSSGGAAFKDGADLVFVYMVRVLSGSVIQASHRGSTWVSSRSPGLKCQQLSQRIRLNLFALETTQNWTEMVISMDVLDFFWTWGSRKLGRIPATISLFVHFRSRQGWRCCTNCSMEIAFC